VHRHHLADGPAGKASAGDIDEIKPAGLRLDLRLRSHPPENLLRISQEREHRGARRRDVRLAADDEWPLASVSSTVVMPARFRRRRVGQAFPLA
jgi:hypothetical protein